MTLHLLYYNDVSDYDHHMELVGLFSSREKAVAAVEKDRAKNKRRRVRLEGVDKFPRQHPLRWYSLEVKPLDSE